MFFLFFFMSLLVFFFFFFFSSRRRHTRSLCDWSSDVCSSDLGEVMVAYEMNGRPLPMLNGFPLRLVVPGWYATYWVKALNEITVLDKPFDEIGRASCRERV